jgi:hypothetical protein
VGKSNTIDVTTYYAGFHFILCHGVIDSIKEVVVNKKTLWTGTAIDGDVITISKPDAFGGLGREGGIEGNIRALFGSKTQTASSYLGQFQDKPTAYRGVVSLILEDMWLGTNYYFKPWWVKAARIHKKTDGTAQWADSVSEPLSGCINPIHVIREILTNKVWGLSVPEERIGASFLTAATTCFNEGRGFSWLWNNTGEIDNFLDEVKLHTNCELYQDRTTGLFEVNLLRKIANPSSLPVLDETIIRKVDNFHTTTIGKLISSVTLQYTNKDNWETATIIKANPSLVARQGYEVSKTIKMLGCTDSNLANTLAEEQLAQASYPLISCTITASAAANFLNPGDAFILTWPDYTSEIGSLVMRVLSINLGTLNNSSVTINVIQDIFSVNVQDLDTVDGTNWESPLKTPIPITKTVQFELPYYFFARKKGNAEAAKVDTDTNYLLTGAVSPSPSSIHAEILSTTGSTYSKSSSIVNFCCFFELESAIDYNDTTIVMTNIIDKELLHINSAILVGDELVFLTAISGSTLTVKRGVMDTHPKQHSAGTDCFAIQSFNGTDQKEYFVGETVSTKLLDVTPIGTLAESAAPILTYTIAGRYHLPYPPQNVRINNGYWPANVTAGTLTITYSSRNRLHQTTKILNSWFDSNIINEPDVTYTCTLTNVGTSVSVNQSGAAPLYFNSVVAGSYLLTFKSTSPNGDCLHPFTHAFTVV